MTGKIAFARAPEPFVAALRERVQTYLAGSGVCRRARLALWIKGLLFTIAAVLSYGALLGSGDSAVRAMASGTGFGLFALLLALNIGHDAAHGAVTGKRGFDHTLQALSFTLLGVDAYLWRLRHVASHHVFPNVNGCDIDIDHNPFFRLSPNQPLHWRHRYQHIYAPVVYGLVALHSVWWQDFAYLLKKDLANLRDIRHDRRRYAEFFACKAAYLTLTFLVPLAVLPFPWWQIAVGHAVATAAVSLCFVFLLIGVHFSSEAEFPEVDGSNRLPHSFAAHAFKTSVDWCPGSRCVAFLVGGTNAHVAHHLFPRLPHTHYRQVTGIVADVAGAFGIRHNTTTLGGMIVSHFRFLHAVGRAPTQ